MNSVSSFLSRDRPIWVNASLIKALKPFLEIMLLTSQTSFRSLVPSLVTYCGCLRFRLEWSDWQSQSARLLDPLGVFIPHKYQRYVGYLPFNQLFPDSPVRPHHQNPYRQYGSIILFAEDGISSFSTSESSYTGFNFFVSPNKDFFWACPHLRQAEWSCRPGFPSGTAIHRVDVGSRIICCHMPKDFSLQLEWTSLPQGILPGFPASFPLARIHWLPTWIPRILFWIRMSSSQIMPFPLPGSYLMWKAKFAASGEQWL